MLDETTHRAALILHGAIHEDDEDGMTCDECCDAADTLKGYGALASPEHDAAVKAEAESERDEWKARHAALRRTVETMRSELIDRYGVIDDILDRDYERGQALGWGDDSECDHDWEPHDLPDPSSAGAVLQRGHICRDCGKVED